MIKHAPILIEFGDGDTGYQIGLTEEGEGCVALFNAEPGEIGREIVGEPPEGSIGAYIVFKNVKSLDCIIEGLTKLRDAMIEEGTDGGSHPTKRPWNCKDCRWGTANGCGRQDDCDNCPNYNDDEHCKCTTVSDGQPCPYFERWEEPIESVAVEKKTGYWSKQYDPINNSTMLQCSLCKSIEVYNGDLVSFPDMCSNCVAEMI